MTINLTEETGTFIPGERYLATVLNVRRSGITVAMPYNKGCGTISARCWGRASAARDAKILQGVECGDTVEVRVKAYDARSRNLSLVLSRCSCERRGRRRVKPAYELIPVGATLLIDTANLLSSIGPKHAEKKLLTIEAALVDRGYFVAFFIEAAALAWVRCYQDPSEVAALDEFCARENVTKVVGGEADLAVLSVAATLPNSYCISQDAFADYRQVFPEIVTTRVRSFCASRVSGVTYLTFFGLREAIVIKECDDAPKQRTTAMKENALSSPPTRAQERHVGLDEECEAITICDRVGRPHRSRSMDDNGKARYDERTARRQATRRLCALRQARLLAERRRSGLRLYGWRAA